MIVWSSLKTLVILVSSVWCVSEIALARIQRSGNDNAKLLDKSSLGLIWLTIIPSVTLGVYLGSRGSGYIATVDSFIPIIGLILMFMGLAIRWAAILTLRNYFTVDVSIQTDHRLVTRGIYKVVRHPAYSGSLLSFLELGLTFSSWLSTIIIFVPILFALLYRIRVEEQALMGFFGEEYAVYCKQTKRLIPYIY